MVGVRRTFRGVLGAVTAGVVIILVAACGSSAVPVSEADVLSLNGDLLPQGIAQMDNNGVSSYGNSPTCDGAGTAVDVFADVDATWPQDLKVPFDQAITAFRTAANACAQGDRAGMSAGMSTGRRFIAMTLSAVKANCTLDRASTDPLGSWLCT